LDIFSDDELLNEASSGKSNFGGFKKTLNYKFNKKNLIPKV